MKCPVVCTTGVSELAKFTAEEFFNSRASCATTTPTRNSLQKILCAEIIASIFLGAQRREQTLFEKVGHRTGTGHLLRDLKISKKSSKTKDPIKVRAAQGQPRALLSFKSLLVASRSGGATITQDLAKTSASQGPRRMVLDRFCRNVPLHGPTRLAPACASQRRWGRPQGSSPTPVGVHSSHPLPQS